MYYSRNNVAGDAVVAPCLIGRRIAGMRSSPACARRKHRRCRDEARPENRSTCAWISRVSGIVVDIALLQPCDDNIAACPQRSRASRVPDHGEALMLDRHLLYRALAPRWDQRAARLLGIGIRQVWRLAAHPSRLTMRQLLTIEQFAESRRRRISAEVARECEAARERG
jgi:hypothetical protein